MQAILNMSARQAADSMKNARSNPRMGSGSRIEITPNRNIFNNPARRLHSPVQGQENSSQVENTIAAQS